jgi:hypothetical protein
MLDNALKVITLEISKRHILSIGQATATEIKGDHRCTDGKDSGQLSDGFNSS